MLRFLPNMAGAVARPVVQPRRRLWRELLVGLGLIGFGVAVLFVGPILKAYWLAGPRAGAAPAVSSDVVAAHAALREIRDAATEAQLNVRVAEPWIRGTMPISAARLTRADARLSDILRAVDAATTALHADAIAADSQRKDTP